MPRQRLRCAGQKISDIVILTQPPYANGVMAKFDFVRRAVRELHVNTRIDVVRRFLLFAPGESCDELRRAESERILRAQPFLADAMITPYSDGEGGVVLEVETRDEFSALFGIGARTSDPHFTAFRAGESNLGGMGVFAAGEWRNGRDFRHLYGGRITDYQFAGRPYQLSIQGSRRQLGGDWSTELRHPYLTDLQRVAWRVAGGAARDYFEFERPVGDDPRLGVRREFADIGGVVRLGVPGRLSLFGASISREVESVDSVAVLARNGNLLPDTASSIMRYAPQRVTRVNLLWGLRNLRFMRVTGFDALTGAQDMRVGFQLGTLFGRALPSLGSKDDDVFVSADTYLGIGTTRSFAALQVQGEGRQNFDRRGEWDGIITSGRAAWYLKPADRHLLLTSLEWGAGWHQRVPFQLSLGDPQGGVRGFGNTYIGGGRRVVMRVEERWAMGRPLGLGDIGLAPFMDVGRMWAGDAPYGMSTKPAVGLGLGLLAAVPPGSRRTWRVDVAYPVTKMPNARLEFRVATGDFTRVFWHEPDDVQQGRERAVPRSIFSWP